MGWADETPLWYRPGPGLNPGAKYLWPTVLPVRPRWRATGNQKRIRSVIKTDKPTHNNIYLLSLLETDKWWNHRLPKRVLLMPKSLIFNSWIRGDKKLKRKPTINVHHSQTDIQKHTPASTSTFTNSNIVCYIYDAISDIFQMFEWMKICDVAIVHRY